MTLKAFAVSDVGRRRETNEDSFLLEQGQGLFAVADGMGGHAAGEVASAMAVETVRKTLEGAHSEIDTFKRAPTDAGRRSIVQLLQSAVLSAHQAVFQRGQHEADKAGMGTTLDVVLIAGPEAFVAHVGDSRTYLVRDGRSSQITTDHTVAEVLVIEGKLTIEEAQHSPLRTILVNAIGVSADVGVEMAHVTLRRGDRLLLCSDGLHDYFPAEEEIAQRLSADAPGDALKDMVELAKTRGGHDNITGIAVEVTDVLEAIPAALDVDLTHPVEVPGPNPFLSDEPTETAVLDLASPKAAAFATPVSSELKSTQPMRIVDDDHIGSADTLPGQESLKLEPTPAPAAGPATDAMLESERTLDLDVEAKHDTSAEAKRSAANAKPTGEPARAPTQAKPADGDHAPAEITAASAGRTSGPGNDKDAG